MGSIDRDALVALYKATRGATWLRKENWNTDKDLSLWHGVEVVGGRVVHLNLSRNNLQGSIPPGLGNLAALETLNLFINQLEGPIPKELGCLFKLKVLWLNKNQLTGHVPKELGDLGDLECLGLPGNQLSGPVPEELGALTALRQLLLFDNELEGSIPPELANLVALEVLYLNGNQLSGSIPAELGNLAALKRLYLHENQLSGSLPAELGKLVALESLHLRGNYLSGRIPAELGNMAGLEELSLGHNRLNEFPPEVLELCRGNLKETGWNDNPWSQPPVTVLESGFESALGWWEDVNRFGTGKSNKLKMVLVGLAEAGKTTIVRHLTGRSVSQALDRTVGIEITSDWKPLGAPLQVSIWDFAGQADYYSSHQLFLTKGALFLLVVDLRAFSEEMLDSDVDNFTDPRGRIYWWLEMLHMRVPGAAIALVGTHVDQMKSVDADQAAIYLHTVVSSFIFHKENNVSRRRSIRRIDGESETTAMEEDTLPADVKQFTRGGTSARRSGSEKTPTKPLVLHDRVFKVSLASASASELQQWILKAASGQECPGGFYFPAVDQTVSKAWIVAYDAMDALKETVPFVLWSKAVEEYRKWLSDRLPDASGAVDASKVLLRAMQHREAEGGVLLSMVDASAPAANDMLHLDPSWLIELVRRLVDHNLVDKKKRGTLEQGLRAYARPQRLKARPLVDMQRAYCKSGHLDKAYLRFLWMHRKMDAESSPVIMTDSEFESIVLMMTRLLVMYTCPGADNLVVPVRLQKYGDQRILDPGNMEESVVKVQGSFGQKYPPPGIVGRFLAWLTEKIDTFGHCWLHGAFFSYSYGSRQCKVFVYESEYEEYHDDETKSKFAGLTLGVEGSPDHASSVLKELTASLEEFVSDSAYGYPGLADLIYFSDEEKIQSTSLRDLRALLDNYGNLVHKVQVGVDRVHAGADRVEAGAGRVEAGAARLEVAAASLEGTMETLSGIVNKLLEQQMLAAGDERSEYPCLVLLRPEQDPNEQNDPEEYEPPEVIQRSGWDRWVQALECLPDVDLHHKFRLHFLCEHDLSVVPCGPDGRGFPVEHLKDWVKQCVPLMQVSLWILRVGVGVMSNVDLPLNDLLDAFVGATGAEILNSMSKAPDTISRGSLPAFGDGAPQADIEKFQYLQGKAYTSLCRFMRDGEFPRQRWSGCFPCRGPLPSTTDYWRESMDRVQNPRTGRYAWVLKTNKEAYLRDNGAAPAAARAPLV